MKKNNLLIATAILCSTHLGFAAETEEKSRYEQIVQAFNAETQTFNANFVKDAGDITVVAQHKEALEKKVATNKGSWAPMALKVLAGLFGFDSVLSIGSAFMKINNTRMAEISYDQSPIIWNIFSFIENYPEYSMIHTTTNPIAKYLDDKLLKLSVTPGYEFGQETYNKRSGLIDIGFALPSAAISTYLFKKANSYGAERKKLEKEIATDKAILEKLKSMQ